MMYVDFFFASRRRHTRCALVTGSSDVCSSDLAMFGIGIGGKFDVEPDRTAVGRLRPGAARRIHAIGKDSGAAPAGIKPFQGGAQVAERGKRVRMSTDEARNGRVDEIGRATCGERV